MTDKHSFDQTRIRFLGLAFDPLPTDRVLSVIDARREDEPFAYVVTPNTDHMVRLHSSLRRFLPLYQNAWLCLCDSKVLYILAKFAGRRLSLVLGSDLTVRLFRHIIQPGEKLCIIGGGDDVVAQLREHVGAYDIAHYNPPMGFVHDAGEIRKCVDFVNANPSRYIFFAVGSPQQEIVAQAVRNSGKATGTGFCIGASIDFLTGKETRAPRWMQKIVLEWLYRLLQNPKGLWKRYLLRGPKIFAIYLSWLISSEDSDPVA